MVRVDPVLVPIALLAACAAGLAFARAARVGPLLPAAVALLLLAAAGMRVPGGRSGETIAAIDVSFSTGVSVGDVRAALDRRAGRPSRLLLFGSAVTEVPVEEGRPVEAADLEVAGRSGSDLVAALRAAARHAAPGTKVIVLTDGRPPGGGVGEAAAALRDRGASVSIREWGRGVPGDARVAEIRAPSSVSGGAGAAALVTVAGDPGRRVRVGVSVDGVGVADREAELPVSGRCALRFALPALAAGFHEVEARVVGGGGDPAPENDRLATGIVAGGRRIALVAGPESLVDSLRRSGFDAEARTAGALDDLRAADLVVLSNVAAPELPDGGRRLRDWVEGGGGLLVLGGDRSFGPGAYAGRPISDPLPLLSAPPGEGVLAVLLIDVSSSMRSPFREGESTRKIDAAREAARRLLRSLPDEATFVLVPFRGEAVPIPPIALGDAGARQRAEAELDRVARPEGRTALVPPLLAALESLRARPGTSSAVLLLTDGRAEGESRDRAEEVAAAIRLAGGRLRILAVGEDADLPRLAALAGDSGEVTAVAGRGEIETAFLDELLRASGAGKVLLGEREVRNGPGEGDPFDGGLPAIGGLVRTWPRPGAAVWRVAREDLPVTAGLRFGLGRAAAVATDPLRGWAEGWRETGVVPALARWASRSPERGGMRVEAVREGDRIRLRVTMPEVGAEASGVVRVPGREAEKVRFASIGAGVCEGTAGAGPAGSGRITIRSAGKLFDGGFCVPYPEEYRESGPDPAGIAALRAATGSGADAGGADRDVRWLPAILALILVVLDRIPRFARRSSRAAG